MAEEFPTMPGGQTVEAPVETPSLRWDMPKGLDELSAHLEGTANVLGQMADKAATVEGRQDASQDATNLNVNPKSDMTVYGQAYNDVAKQALSAQRVAAMTTDMGQAYQANPDNPAELTKSLQAIKAGYETTGYQDLDTHLDSEFTLRASGLIDRAQVGLKDKMTQVAAGAYQQAFENGSQGLEQAAAGATFDAAGAGQIQNGWQQFVKTLAQYGPREAFDVAGQHFDADPTRAAAITPAIIQAHAEAALGEAKRQWFVNAQMASGDAAAQARFSDDARERYTQGDPIFQGMDGQQAEALFRGMDGQAQKASTDEQGVQRQMAQSVGQRIEALQWGADVDTHQLVEDAQKSGDPGLVAKAQFYSEVARTQPGVLKTVVARSLGILPEPGQGKSIPPVLLDGAGRPIVAAPPGVSAVADQVRGFAGAAGATPDEQNTLVKFATIESQLNPAADNGVSHGLFQFQTPTWSQVGGGDITSVRDQTRNALTLLRQDKAALTASLGRPPSEGELYLAHQQGPAGAAQLLSRPNAAAASIVGEQAVERNLPASLKPQAATMSAAQFAAVWTSRFDGPSGGATAIGQDPNASGNWQPPPGAKPGSPAFVAWANTQTGFAADPLKYAAEHSVGSVPPMIPQNGLSQDPAAVSTWAQAMRGRQGVGRTLQSNYGVPFRMFTDAEKDDYASILRQDPSAGLHLASALSGALGPNGARAALREIGENDETIATQIHIGDLAAMGSGQMAASAAAGMQLKANGAKDLPDSTSWNQAWTQIGHAWGPAFANDPTLFASARNTVEAARLNDANRGVAHPADWYFQGALGQTRNPAGGTFGGAGVVNGAPAVLPPWLGTDRAPDALRELGDDWAAHPSNSTPVFANGRPMAGADVARMQMVRQPDGNYLLRDPKSGMFAGSKAGAPFRLNLEGGRSWLADRLPDAVRR